MNRPSMNRAVVQAFVPAASGLLESQLGQVQLRRTRFCPQQRSCTGAAARCSAALRACVAADPTEAAATKNIVDVAPPTTDETFAIDAGRDLFFTAMDADIARTLISAPLDGDGLPAPEDRFIAAERLKFYPSDAATEAILDFILRFDTARLDNYRIEDRVSRRKAVETLGRYKGAFRRDSVIACLVNSLSDPDPYMVEVAIWSLAEIGIGGSKDILEKVAAVLDNDAVSKRVVIQTLMRAEYAPAIDRIRQCITSPDPATSSAALTAVCILGGDHSSMDTVINVLKSDNLNVRRAALEDITLSKHTAALPHVAVAPNSLVLRSRTTRVLLEELSREDNHFQLDHDTAALIDRLMWDHPSDLDLLGKSKDTKKARELSRNIRQLYKNDALYSYLAARTIAEDHRNDVDAAAVAGDAVLVSFTEKPYFDYFGAYHIFRTLGWLRHRPSVDVLSENAANLPPRFFNHQAGALLALAEIGDPSAYPVVEEVAKSTFIWELKYACLIASERLGVGDSAIRKAFSNDKDWLIRARARCDLGFDHLRSDFT